MATPDDTFWSEKISIEPDLGDQRKSIYKALPSPPTTPKRVLMKYRFSALITLLLAMVSFVLTLVVILAGNKEKLFEEHYLVALNTTKLGQDIIRFEPVTATPAAASPTSSTTKPINPLNPLSIDNPLNPNNPSSPFHDLNGAISALTDNVTSAIDEGLGKVLNEFTEEVVTSAGIKDYYFLYLQKICSGSTSKETNTYVIDNCQTWHEANEEISSQFNTIQSSIIIGKTNVSIPIIQNLTSSLNSISHTIATARKAVFAFLIISLIASGLSIVSTVPAIFFPQSRMLIYINILPPLLLSSPFALLSALLLTLLIVGTTSLSASLGGDGAAIGIQISQGTLVLLFVWWAWAFSALAAAYWTVIWFVEVRTWSFVRRRRTASERGDWMGVGREVWRDFKGGKEA